MSEEFKITSNVSKYASNSLISSLDINAPEAYPITSMGIACIVYCEMEAIWLIERNGNSEPEHIDLIFAVDGEFSIESPYGKESVTVGKVALIASWVDRRLSVERGSSKHLYIRIDDVEKYPQIQGIEVRDSFYAEELVYFVRHIEQMSGPFSDSSEYCCHLYSAIQFLLNKEIWSDKDEAFSRLERLFNGVNKNSSRKCGVSELAKQLGVSISSFYKICMQSYGKSPGRIIGEIKMRKATELLRNTGFSLENISEQLGYANQFAFSKAFKKATGFSPGEYRERNNRLQA